jgi:ABC-type uncharacterized transport system YnjBCD substrate-binding protein
MKIVCDVADEVAAGKTTSGGAVDLIWINGKNFAKMKEEVGLRAKQTVVLLNVCYV